jgi:hypothetical protein
MAAHETITGRRCGQQTEFGRDGDATIVPAGWRRIVMLTAGPGTRVSEDLDINGVTEAFWLCPVLCRSETRSCC